MRISASQPFRVQTSARHSFSAFFSRPQGKTQNGSPSTSSVATDRACSRVRLSSPSQVASKRRTLIVFWSPRAI
jgi:hypothetical protein